MDARAHDTGIRFEELDPARPRPIETPWGSFTLFRVERPGGGPAVRAVESFCPHLLGPLFQGTVAGDTVVCPWHRWRFSLETGERLDAPPDDPDARARLRRLEVAPGPRGTLVLAPPAAP